jgi:spoIIIJ-associated protein
MESVEASGKSIEDAILQALARLGRNRDEVEITVLQQPSRGTRGMGAREARVRVHVKPHIFSPDVAMAPNMGMPDDESGESYEEDYYEEDDEYFAPDAQESYGPPLGRQAPVAAPQIPSASTAALRDELPEDASIEEVAIAALQTILDHMGVRAELETEETPEDEPLKLNIVPDADYVLGTLIGRRGETLAALQLLVNLITYKQTGEHERIIVDVEGYRARREENLRSMAERVAQQVRNSGRAVMLEAMPPNERRIIHMALADYEDISSDSTGVGEERRVVVSLRSSPQR